MDITINDICFIEFESIDIEPDTNYYNCEISEAWNLKADRECTTEEIAFIEENFPKEVWQCAMDSIEAQAERDARGDW